MEEVVNFYINVVAGLISIFGIADNVMNAVIFRRIGLKDSMSVGLFLLSCSDILVCIFTLVDRIFAIIDYLSPEDNPVSLLVITYVATGWIRDSCYLISCWITTLLSVERCVCVVSPFRVKQVFTKVRCAVIVAAIYIIIFILHAPVYATQRAVWIWQPTITSNDTTPQNNSGLACGSGNGSDGCSRWANGTSRCVNGLLNSATNDSQITSAGEKETVRTDGQFVLGIAFTENRAEVDVYIDIVTSIVLPLPSQIIVVVCAVLLVIGLQTSSRVRGNEAYTNADENNKNEGGNSDSKSGGDDAQKRRPKNYLSVREARLIKVVIWMAVVLTICNVPKILAIFSSYIFPNIKMGGSNQAAYFFVWNMAALFGAANSTANTFIYLAVNRNFRSSVKAICTDVQ